VGRGYLSMICCEGGAEVARASWADDLELCELFNALADVVKMPILRMPREPREGKAIKLLAHVVGENGSGATQEEG